MHHRFLFVLGMLSTVFSTTPHDITHTLAHSTQDTTIATLIIPATKDANEYEHYRDGGYRRKKGNKGLGKDAEFLQWDYTHNDVEVYNKGRKHIGSLDPNTLELYKAAVANRSLPD